MNNLRKSRLEFLAPFFFFLFGLFCVTLQQSHFFTAIPGDLGDARFNNLILEHLYRWMAGKDPYLWSPDFFFPYPGTLSFSDNHFGTALIYALFRLIGLSPEGAFVGWYTAAAPLNYFSCYYALRKSELSASGAAVGAFIFAFAFTASIQYGHPQLNYRFSIPMAMLAWYQFVQYGGAIRFAKIAIWVTLQFYCSIYLGYFLLLLLAASFVAQYLMRLSGIAVEPPHQRLFDLIRHPRANQLMGGLLILIGCVMALTILLYPYMYYSHLYGFQRTEDDIASMLPRPWSYLIQDESRLWGRLSIRLPAVPMRNEQQMFFGLAAIILAGIGALRNSGPRVRSALISLFALVLATLSVHGHSFYSFIQHLPLANAIRAVSRIGMVMLFPLGLLAGSGYDWLTARGAKVVISAKIMLCFALTLLMLAEYSTLTAGSVLLTDWRGHQNTLENEVPAALPKDAIIFVPLRADTPLFMTELDGMSLGQALNRKTINGYSGNAPSNFYAGSLDPCAQAQYRLAGYAQFANLSQTQFSELLNREFVVGEKAQCPLTGSMLKFRHTHFSGPLSTDRIHQLSIAVEQITLTDHTLSAVLLLKNASNEPLASVSDTNQPINMSWRLINTASPPRRDIGWNPRTGLVSDVPARGSESAEVTLAAPVLPGRYKLQASVVQDGVVWFHDTGMEVATSNQTIEVKTDGSLRIAQ